MSRYPVFITEKDADLYYNGFRINLFWHLFNYIPVAIISTEGKRKFDAMYFQEYCRVNHRFSDAVV